MAESDTPHRGSPPPDDALAAARVAFPQKQEEFEQDPRVSFSKLDGKYILEDDDGSSWDYNTALQKWIPSLDEDLIKAQQQAYTVDGVDENEPAQPAKNKRKKSPTEEGHEDGIGDKKKSKRSNLQQNTGERENTAVYVTSLPLDATSDEIASVFSKYGVIAEEISSRNLRIKMYKDENENFKGDALVVYFRPESVNLAIQMLDDSDFRFGQSGPNGPMRVSVADLSYKKEHVAGEKEASDRSGKKGRRNLQKEREQIKLKTQKLNERLADWSDDDTAAITDTAPRYDKVVVLEHMFTLKELKDDPAAILDIKEDVREECEKLGEVTNVQLFDREPTGVVTVRFANSEAAKACIDVMGGRKFSGQEVVAYLAKGRERFRKTKKTAEEDGDEYNRLDSFGKFLEEEDALEGDDDENDG